MTPDITLWRSGCVRRWHNNIDHHLRESGDDTASHQWRVTMLLLMLHPLPSSHLISCALTHDVPEVVVGDTPGPMKVGLLGDALEAIEASVAERYGLPFAKEKDKKWIKLCDKLDALLWVRERAPHLLATKEWGDAWDGVLKIADELGVKDKVEVL